ncbi:MAG: STAS/SEC14 domain-containing protein [Defluviicoccus sp.]
MIALKADEANRILTIEMAGVVTAADIDAAMDQLQAQYPAVGVHIRGGEYGSFNVLLDWENLAGWEKGAKTVGLMMGKFISDPVQKLAVVADAKWTDEQPRLADIAKRATVRFFPLGQRAAATAWLSEK